MRIEGTVEDIKKFFKGADIYDGVCNDNCDTCKRFDDCPVPAESEEAAKEECTELDFRPKMYNLTELSMPWENDDVFNESAWQPDTLHPTNFETGILYHLIHDVLPRHMPIYDWNRPWAEAIILMMRREIIKYLAQTNTPVQGPLVEQQDVRGDHRIGQPPSQSTDYICTICGFTEVAGIFNINNWASKDTCSCCAAHDDTPEASLALRPWLKTINTNAGKEDNAAKAAMDEHVHTHNEPAEERICKICGVTDNKIVSAWVKWAAPDLCQVCADTRKPKAVEKSSESQDIVQCTERTPILKISPDDASPLASGGSGGISAGGGMHQGSVPVGTYKFPAIGDTQVHISLDDILIPAFEHDRKLKNNFKTLFFTQIVGSQAVLSYMGTKLYVNREKVLQLPHPIPRGYFSKQKSGTPSNRVAAIRLYREYLAGSVIGTVQKDSSVPPSPSPAVQSGSDQIHEIKPFVDMRESKERHIIGDAPLKSDLLIPRFKWDEQGVKQYKKLAFFEADDGKVMLAYMDNGSRIFTTKEKSMSMPYPVPMGYEPLKVFASNPRTALRQYREYLAKVAKSEQTADSPEQNPPKHEQTGSDHEQNPEKACDKCGTDISDMKGRNLCDDCQHAVIEAEAARKKKLEEKAEINRRKWHKDESPESEKSEPGKMSEKTQKLHDLVTGHKVGPGTKFGDR